MSRKELEKFLEYTEENEITLINPNNLSLGELHLYAVAKGFEVSVSDIVDFMNEITQKKESDLNKIERKWKTD